MPFINRARSRMLILYGMGQEMFLTKLNPTKLLIKSSISYIWYINLVFQRSKYLHKNVDRNTSKEKLVSFHKQQEF